MLNLGFAAFATCARVQLYEYFGTIRYDQNVLTLCLLHFWHRRINIHPERINTRGFSGFSTVWQPQTAGVTDNPRPPPLSGEPPIGLGAGGKDPGPGGRPGGPLSRRRGPFARVGAQRGVLRFRLPCGTPLARHAPPSPTEAQLNSNNRAELGTPGGPRAGGSPPASKERAVHAVPKAATHRRAMPG